MALTTITNSMVSVNAIQGTLIADNAITAVHIATNAVSGTLIADNAITAVHIAQNVITVTQLADDAVEADKIADGVITTNHLNKAMISSQTEVAVATGDFVLLGDTSDSNNLKKAPISSILAGTLTTAAQTNITSVGTLTSFRSTGIDDNADALAITIDSSENVGIGEASPGARLHVSDSNSSTDLTDANTIASFERAGNARVLIATNTGNTGSLEFGDSGGARQGRISYAHSDDSLAFFTTGSQRMSISAAGNVGIGTTNIGNNRLDVNGDISTGWSTNTKIGMKYTTGSYFLGLEMLDSGRQTRLVSKSADNTGYIAFDTGTGATERMRINAAGNVGIGTASPSYALDIDPGSSSAFRILNATNDQDVNCTITNSGTGTGSDSLFDLTTAAGAGDPIIRWSIAGNENYQMGIDNSDSDKLKISQGTALGTNDRIVIHGGNVGIGTAAPSAALHVYTGASGAINIGLTNSERYWKMQTDGGELTFNDVTAGDLARMKIDTSGRVGINRTPAITNCKLEIGGADNVNLIAVEASGRTFGLGVVGGSGSTRGGKIFVNTGLWCTANLEGNTSYTADGLFGGSATPTSIACTGSGSLKLGYRDNGSGLYSGAMALAYDAIDGLSNTAYVDGFVMRDTGNSTTHLTIETDGDIRNTNGTFTSLSDERIKSDIADASSQWNDIKAVKVRKFKLATQPAPYNDKFHIGVIAQELEAAGMNGLIKESDPDTKHLEYDSSLVDQKIKSVKYSILHVKALKALQEAMTRIETLEAKVATLESE